VILYDNLPLNGNGKVDKTSVLSFQNVGPCDIQVNPFQWIELSLPNVSSAMISK